MDETPVLVVRRDGYRVLTLNRPQRLNAFTLELHRVLSAAIAEAEQDQSCRALLLTGAGRAFSSGQDLNERIDAAGNVAVPGEALEKYYNPLVRKLRSLPFPVVCAVNGIAAGAACNIALACDIVLAARSASFLQAFARLGLVPDAGGKVLDDADLMTEAEKLCAHFATAPTFGLGLIKRAFDSAEDNDLKTQLDLERQLQREAGSHPDYAEGVKAFLGKRKPNFSGKR
jgi:2-(1,2-epoxy-1,2-dihydrophenyl)acetyl-CoA isomerase